MKQFSFSHRRNNNNNSLLLHFFIAAFSIGVSFSSVAQSTENSNKLKLTGTAGADLTLYNMSPEYLARGENFSWSAYASLNLQWRDIQLPFSFIISEQQRSFRQPFNHFGIAPTWKKIKIYAGYSNMTFSSTSLAGATFLGGGLEANPGHFRLGLMLGKFNKGVAENSDPALEVAPTYKRVGYGVRIGVGTSDRFVDFIYFKAKDDSSSIPSPKTDFQITPMENVIAGINIHQKFSKKITWDLEASTSVLTRDLRFTDTLPSTGAYVYAKKVADINASSNLNFAVLTKVQYTSKYFNLKTGFTHIDPHYTSLGSYYFRNDLQKIYLAPTIKLKKNKILLSMNTSTQHDNLFNSKKATTNLFYADATLTVQATNNFSFDIPFGMFRNYQTAGNKPLDDTTKIDMVNIHKGFSPRYTLTKEKNQQNFLLILNWQKIHDNNPFTAQYTENNLSTNNITYTYTVLATSLTLTGAFDFGKSTSQMVSSSFKGISVGASKPFLKNTAQANSMLSIHSETYNKVASGTTILLNLNGTYKLKTKHSFSLNFNLIKQTAAGNFAGGFTEVKTIISYAYSF